MKPNCEKKPTAGPTGRRKFRRTIFKSNPHPMLVVLIAVKIAMILEHKEKGI